LLREEVRNSETWSLYFCTLESKYATRAFEALFFLPSIWSTFFFWMVRIELAVNVTAVDTQRG
jgi:hypothetical protein